MRVGFAEYGRVIQVSSGGIPDGGRLARELAERLDDFVVVSRAKHVGVRVDADAELDALVVFVTVRPIVSTPIPHVGDPGKLVRPLEMAKAHMAPVIAKVERTPHVVWVVNDARCHRGSRDMPGWKRALGNFSAQASRAYWKSDVPVVDHVRYGCMDSIGLSWIPDPGYHGGGFGVYGVERNPPFAHAMASTGAQVRGIWPTLDVDDYVDVRHGELLGWRVAYLPPQMHGAVTLKAWELFTWRVAVLAHPDYDADRVLPLEDWQRCDYADAAERAEMILHDTDLYRTITDRQRAAYEERFKTRPHVDAIISMLTEDT